MPPPTKSNETSERFLEDDSIGHTTSSNVQPAEPVIVNGQERLATTTSDGELSFVGLIPPVDKGHGVASGERQDDGPPLSVRSTRKEPTNPVMAK
jgi:hypothetical protein